MVRPETLGRVIQELLRIFPRSREALQNAFLQHVLGTVAFANLFEQARPNLFHQVALGFEFGSRHHGTIRGHDFRLIIASASRIIHRVHAAADPGAGEIIERRIAQRRCHVADRENIRSS